MTEQENSVKESGEALEFRRLRRKTLRQRRHWRAVVFQKAWSQSAWESGLSDANAFYAGAFLGERLVGCCGFWQSFEDADVCNVAVDPFCRRQRIGERLLQFLMEKGKMRGRRKFYARSARIQSGRQFPCI